MNCKSKKLVNDLLLMSVLLLIAVAVFFVFKFTAKDGKSVAVIIDGKQVYSYSLSEDIKQTVYSNDDKSHSNTLVISDGEAYVESADCPDKICVNHRRISKVGETIVCLPNKLVIEIKQ